VRSYLSGIFLLLSAIDHLVCATFLRTSYEYFINHSQVGCLSCGSRKTLSSALLTARCAEPLSLGGVLGLRRRGRSPCPRCPTRVPCLIEPVLICSLRPLALARTDARGDRHALGRVRYPPALHHRRAGATARPPARRAPCVPAS
jgi:hypothetical protein